MKHTRWLLTFLLFLFVLAAAGYAEEAQVDKAQLDEAQVDEVELEEAKLEEAQVEKVELEYFGEMGCAHCDLFQEKILPAAEEKADISAEAAYYDILSESGYKLCEEKLEEMGLSFSIFPVLFIGNNAYQGNSAVEDGLSAELNYFAEHGEYRPRRAAAGESRDAGESRTAGESRAAAESREDMRLAFIPIFLAGLTDGVNPCAFATMLFFLSWIALKDGSRRRMLLAGSGFIIGVFLAYLAIGFGLFSFFRTAGSLGIIRQIMRYLFSSLALLFALLSFRDAVIIRKTGEAKSMLLQLPSGLKKRIHSVIRRSEGAGKHHSILILPMLMVTGGLVAFLELACTGQIYFPTIAFMVQSGEGHRPIFWLLLYNGAFILPLLMLYGLVLAGVSQQKISSWFRRNLAAGKFAAALLFALLAAVIWISG
ncbi:MAG: hypothetical protein K9K78_08600 [Spirochaetales bacterium]|nr:hypothetical protein [Spirochaetales bacterium]